MAIVFAGFSVGDIAIWLLALCLLVTAILFYFKPIMLVRTGAWIVRHTVYKLRVIGRENIPAAGPVLLVCNHVSAVRCRVGQLDLNPEIHFVIFAGWPRV